MKKLLIYLCLLCPLFPSFAGKSLESTHFKTSNGARVIFYHAPEVPMLEIKAAFAAGSAYDNELFGLSALTTELLNQGNAGKDATAIAEQLADTGAQYSSVSTRDMVILSLKTLAEPKALDTATEVFADIIARPDFKPTAFKREKKQQLMAIHHAEESPNEIANQVFFQALYQEHPYAHPILGTTETVKQITIDDVKNFYRDLFVSKNTIIVLVGAINKNQARQIAEKLTKNLPEGKPAAKLPKAKPLTESAALEVPFPSSQTVIRLGELGITHHNRDYFPLLVGNYILGGGGLVSQLALEVRAKRGLTYGIYSQFLPLTAIGPFIISLSTQTNQAKTAIDVTRDTLERFVTEGPTEQELKDAKQYLTGSFPLALASNSQIADMLLKVAFYNLPNNYLDTYIQKVEQTSTKDIKAAFKNHVSPSHLLQVTVGKK